MPEFIRKRDGRLVPFEEPKITHALRKAVRAVGGTDMEKANAIGRQMVGILDVIYKDGRVATVENVVPGIARQQQILRPDWLADVRAAKDHIGLTRACATIVAARRADDQVVDAVAVEIAVADTRTVTIPRVVTLGLDPEFIVERSGGCRRPRLGC